jgi:AraC-like DNA-binding protein
MDESPSTNLICDERPSDSPFVERIWHSHATSESGPFISMAESHWSMVVTRFRGRAMLTVRGPETRATPAFAPPDAEFFGIMFRPGAFMPDMPAGMVMDRRDVTLPAATSQSFWLKGRAWQFPDYENADTFVDWLARENLLVHDPLIQAALQAQPLAVSPRTVQRRVLQATGLTLGALAQIRRARHALALLQQGVPILDVVEQAGYADQPHLTRALKYRIGHTPAQIARRAPRAKLSFLFKTEVPLLV